MSVTQPNRVSKNIYLTIAVVLIIGATIYFTLSQKKVATVTNTSPVVKEFTSTVLGIQFSYADKNDLNQKTSVKEVGDTVYVHSSDTKPEDGQYVRVFSKKSTETLEQAIKQQFLTSYNSRDCYVQSGMDVGKTKPDTGITAIIAYPIVATNDQWLINQAKCPAVYTSTNGISYFWVPSNSSTKFVFFSIGQYIIPGNTSTDSWHTTLTLTPPSSASNESNNIELQPSSTSFLDSYHLPHISEKESLIILSDIRNEQKYATLPEHHVLNDCGPVVSSKHDILSALDAKAKVLIINKWYPIIRTPNSQRWSTDQAQKFMNDDTLICGVGSFYPFEATAEYVLWRSSCSSGALFLDDKGIPDESITQCIQAQEVISKAFQLQD